MRSGWRSEPDGAQETAYGASDDATAPRPSSAARISSPTSASDHHGINVCLVGLWSGDAPACHPLEDVRAWSRRGGPR